MNPLHWSFRTAFAACALLCAAFLAFAYYAQFKLFLDPCPLCIFQRVAFLALLIVSVIAAIHVPTSRGGRRTYGVLAFLASAVGVSIAGRHVYLQHLPEGEVPACSSMGLDYMLDAFPLSDVVKRVFTGSGECAKVDWTFLGLSMPEWTLAWFAIFAIGALYFGFRNYAHR